MKRILSTILFLSLMSGAHAVAEKGHETVTKFERGDIEAVTRQLKSGEDSKGSIEFLVPATGDKTVRCYFQGNAMKCVEEQTPPRCPGAVTVDMPDGSRLTKDVDCGPPHYGVDGAECDCEWAK